jgi:hypothetical protein
MTGEASGLQLAMAMEKRRNGREDDKDRISYKRSPEASHEWPEATRLVMHLESGMLIFCFLAPK